MPLTWSGKVDGDEVRVELVEDFCFGCMGAMVAVPGPSAWKEREAVGRRGRGGCQLQGQRRLDERVESLTVG